jgi:hypothetical protein
LKQVLRLVISVRKIGTVEVAEVSLLMLAGSEKPKGTAPPSENHALPVPEGPNFFPLNVILASGQPEPGLTFSSTGFGSGGGWELCADAAWAAPKNTSRPTQTPVPRAVLNPPISEPPCLLASESEALPLPRN